MQIKIIFVSKTKFIDKKLKFIDKKQKNKFNFAKNI